MTGKLKAQTYHSCIMRRWLGECISLDLCWTALLCQWSFPLGRSIKHWEPFIAFKSFVQ